MSGLDEQMKDFPECGSDCDGFLFWEGRHENGHILLYFNTDNYLGGDDHPKVNRDDSNIDRYIGRRQSKTTVLEHLKVITCQDCAREATLEEANEIKRLAIKFLHTKGRAFQYGVKL